MEFAFQSNGSGVLYQLCIFNSSKGCVIVDPEFIKDFGDQLRPVWHIHGWHGSIHSVSFHQLMGAGFLGHGWDQVRAFYGIAYDRWIVLGFIGESNFRIAMYANNTSTTLNHNINLKRSKSPSQRDDGSFTVTLTSNKVTSSQLYLPNKLSSQVLMSSSRGPWLLRGPTGIEVECKILSKPKSKIVKFGTGWQKFSRYHELKSGDRCTFSPIEGQERTIEVTIQRG